MPSIAERAEKVVRELGHGSLAEAFRKANLPYTTGLRILREGMPRNPSARTVDALKALGLFDLVTHS